MFRISYSKMKSYASYLLIFLTGIFIGLQIQSIKDWKYNKVQDNWDFAVLNKYMMTKKVESPQTSKSELTPHNELKYPDLRVSCWISSSPKSVHKASAVAATWAKRCTNFAAMSSKTERSNPFVVALNITESYETLWAKTKAAFIYMYERYHNQTDWYLKSDDDTYVIMENLKSLVRDYDPNESYYLGCRFKGDFMSGGAGYVLSREALRRLVEKGFRGGVCDKGDTGSEDMLLGQCLLKLGTTIIDTIDKQERLRFLALPPEDFIIPGRLVGNRAWYYKLAYYPINLGLHNCCSNYPVTFHYISPERMFAIEYFLYSVKIFGNDEILERGTN